MRIQPELCLCRGVCADIPYLENSLFVTSLTMYGARSQKLFHRSSGHLCPRTVKWIIQYFSLHLELLEKVFYYSNALWIQRWQSSFKVKMVIEEAHWVWFNSDVDLLVASTLTNSHARENNENGMKSAVYLSPKFELKPGSVANRVFNNIDFPKGHIAIKSFNAEVVDEAGNPIPLHETYLHHWIVLRNYQRKGIESPKNKSDNIIVSNSGLCKNGLEQIFGLGSETRRTDTHVPDPYGIEVGNPIEIPQGFEERWFMNVHAIDTRGAEDKLGCTECRCDLYNATEDENGEALRKGYIGGMDCCHDGTKCKVREGFEGVKRTLFMRYTVKWVDWDSSIVPVKIYVLDVTDTWKKGDSNALDTKHHCLIEYDVESCAGTSVSNEGCIDNRTVSLSMPTGGNVIYGVAHQHTGGIGSTLYGEDGRILCSSIPTYGEGKEAGNEEGYIVGMSTCYPNPGSVKISDGETLVLESIYNRSQSHSGVMGLFYILVADDILPNNPNSVVHAPVEKQEKMTVPNSVWGVTLFGVAIAIVAVVAYHRRSKRKNGYQSITMSTQHRIESS
ncbi:hypothetical protein TEA_010618 [Camellia sinensis var. sinensis]|uniref:Stress up-regulated Nod 19 protein n=1 Tax=Camellia sinensis var. sinensis TaxID=542762 RepID=A0A4S4D9M0_CAMSN|nr:hypothetical protein TEA_010618 [Camellia sinensis var. sinensis]